MTNDEIITSTAIDFIRATYDKPFREYANMRHDRFIDAIAEDLSKDGLTLEQYTEILQSDIDECCYLLSNFAISENDIFHFLDGRIKYDLINFSNGDSHLRTFVELDDVGYRGNTKVIRKKLFIIGDDNYKPIKRTAKMIEIYEVENG